MNIEGFIITLERAVQRRPQVEKLKATIPVKCNEVNAVDGRALAESELRKHIRKSGLKPHYPFSLCPGEVGAFLSHRKSWKEIIDRDLDAGLIVEDDVDINIDVFSHGFSLAASRIRPGQIYKFDIKNPGSALKTESIPAVTVRTPGVVPLGAQAQLVSREAAERLLAQTETFDRPIDTLMQMTWITGVSYLLVEPSGIAEVSSRLGGSTIQVKKRPITETAYRNVARPIYRTNVWIRSRLQRVA